MEVKFQEGADRRGRKENTGNRQNWRGGGNGGLGDTGGIFEEDLQDRKNPVVPREGPEASGQGEQKWAGAACHTHIRKGSTPAQDRLPRKPCSPSLGFSRLPPPLPRLAALPPFFWASAEKHAVGVDPL